MVQFAQRICALFLVLAVCAFGLTSQSANASSLHARSAQTISTEITGLGNPDAVLVSPSATEAGSILSQARKIAPAAEEASRQAQYQARSTGCSTGCSNGCSNGCSTGCSVGCR
jgi:hypothetical protein